MFHEFLTFFANYPVRTLFALLIVASAVTGVIRGIFVSLSGSHQTAIQPKQVSK